MRGRYVPPIHVTWINCEEIKELEMLRFLLVASIVTLCACAHVPVEQTTLRNAKGGTTTCNLEGRGFVSYELGKSRYDGCVTKAHDNGYE
jgi:hypothetical protein